MSEHRLLFSLVILASFANLSWALIIYVLSFHGAHWLVERISDSAERRPSGVPVSGLIHCHGGRLS